MKHARNRYKTLIACAFLALSGGTAAAAKEPGATAFHLTTLSLLQPEPQVGERISVNGIVSMTDAIVAQANPWSANGDPRHAADDCSVFVAIRPRHRFKTWTSCRSFDGADLDTRIAQEIDEKSVPDAKGLVVYAIHGRTADHQAFPAAWKAAIDGSQTAVEITAIVDKVWPE